MNCGHGWRLTADCCECSHGCTRCAAHKDALRVQIADRDRLLEWTLQFAEGLPKATPEELRDWIARAKEILTEHAK